MNCARRPSGARRFRCLARARASSGTSPGHFTFHWLPAHESTAGRAHALPLCTACARPVAFSVRGSPLCERGPAAAMGRGRSGGMAGPVLMALVAVSCAAARVPPPPAHAALTLAGAQSSPYVMRVMRNPKASRELTRMATGAGGLRLRGGGLLSCFGCCGAGEDARMSVMLLLSFSPLPV